MKKIITLVSIILMGYCSSTAQAIPDNVKSAMTAKYAGAKGLHWDASGGVYTAFFTVDAKTYFVRYDGSATVLEDQHGIDAKALPHKITKKIEKDYPGYAYQNVSLFYKQDPTQYDEDFLKKEPKHYEVFVEKDHASYKLYFSPKGKLLNVPEKKMLRSM